MTAMLQNTFSSGYSYGRTANTKNYSPIERQFTSPSPYGDASIWCAPSGDEIAPIKPPTKTLTNERNSGKLSLALPPISRPFNQWRPSDERYNANSQREEPLTAHSKSHPADSATLTPSSRSMSGSEYSVPHCESGLKSHSIHTSNSKRLNNAENRYKWDQIGEFQPLSQSSRFPMPKLPIADPQRTSLISTKSKSSDQTRAEQMNTQYYNTPAATQNMIDSIPASRHGMFENTKSYHHQAGDNRELYTINAERPNGLLTAPMLNQEMKQQHRSRTSLQPLHTNFDTSRAQNVHDTQSFYADVYNRKGLLLGQESRLVASGQSKKNSDDTTTLASIALNGGRYVEEAQYLSGTYYGGFHGPNFGAQHPHYRVLYPGQSNPAYQTQPFNLDYQSIPFGVCDTYHNSNTQTDTASSNQYLLADMGTENPHESTHIVRSQLLEDFRMNHKTRKFEFREIYGYIVEFSGDQLGSRFIQHKLESANSDEKDQVFTEIANDSRQLMTDVFGNYVIQKLFEHGNQSQKKMLANQMRGHMLTLSMQTYGCRVVQKAFEHILTDQQASLVRELDGHILKVVENQNGNHVIQKAIECIPGEYVDFIIQAHRGHVHYLSKHSYGCRVIQRMLEYCQPKAKRVILDELHHDITDLIQDPFGNYVVQHVIVNGEQFDRKPVIDKVQMKLVENAMHKFASNVVEKALDYADEEQRSCMLQKLTARDDDGQSLPTKLLNHQFGNYVIQKAAMHLRGPTLQSVIEDMERYLAQLRRVSTGKQVAALEENIRNAKGRLDSYRPNSGMLNIPTQPSRFNVVRR